MSSKCLVCLLRLRYVSDLHACILVSAQLSLTSVLRQQRLALIRIYALLSTIASVLVVAAGFMRVVIHFAFKVRLLLRGMGMYLSDLRPQESVSCEKHMRLEAYCSLRSRLTCRALAPALTLCICAVEGELATLGYDQIREGANTSNPGVTSSLLPSVLTHLCAYRMDFWMSARR